MLDYVNPTPKGTVWGLGGTCVNVGCIPKKLIHQAAILRMFLPIISTTSKTGVVKNITARTIALATGERPRYPSIPGAKEFGITSDDLFSLSYKPKKALLVGASYVSLECAGFLHSIGVDVTVMVRSIFLRGFDQQMAEMIGEHMGKSGIRILRPCIPTGIKKKESVGGENHELDQYEVSGVFQNESKQVFVEDFDTVIFAIGRDPCTTSMGLSNVGVKLTNSQYIETDEEERTNVPNIYALGDINARGLKLTPVAIQSGKLLARRLYAANDELVSNLHSRLHLNVFVASAYTNFLNFANAATINGRTPFA
ncbi:unnamed protein product [Dibothriocephalus latus]|uniref:FAD/NAD(P)-binding domain-containing protein n=1 Tax=Dibothriocephalus latus TaxID=60516 RepID=A0A3P7L1P0_DIBLA|nr:unnamed protein product [Dibothriocephalus latus]